MTQKRRSKKQIAQDNVKIAQWLRLGMTQQEMADRLGVHQTTISDNVRDLQRQWQVSQESDLKAWRSEVVTGYQTIYHEAMTQWHEKHQASLLARANDALDRLANFVGLNPVSRLDVTSHGESVRPLSDEERAARVLHLLAKVRARVDDTTPDIDESDIYGGNPPGESDGNHGLN